MTVDSSLTAVSNPDERPCSDIVSTLPFSFILDGNLNNTLNYRPSGSGDKGPLVDATLLVKNAKETLGIRKFDPCIQTGQRHSDRVETQIHRRGWGPDGHCL